MHSRTDPESNRRGSQEPFFRNLLYGSEEIQRNRCQMRIRNPIGEARERYLILDSSVLHRPATKGGRERQGEGSDRFVPLSLISLPLAHPNHRRQLRRCVPHRDDEEQKNEFGILSNTSRSLIATLHSSERRIEIVDENGWTLKKMTSPKESVWMKWKKDRIKVIRIVFIYKIKPHWSFFWILNDISWTDLRFVNDIYWSIGTYVTDFQKRKDIWWKLIYIQKKILTIWWQQNATYS